MLKTIASTISIQLGTSSATDMQNTSAMEIIAPSFAPLEIVPWSRQFRIGGPRVGWLISQCSIRSDPREKR